MRDPAITLYYADHSESSIERARYLAKLRAAFPGFTLAQIEAGLTSTP